MGRIQTKGKEKEKVKGKVKERVKGKGKVWVEENQRRIGRKRMLKGRTRRANHRMRKANTMTMIMMENGQVMKMTRAMRPRRQPWMRKPLSSLQPKQALLLFPLP